MRLLWMLWVPASVGCVATYDIAAHKEPCFADAPQLCMIVDDGEGERFHFHGIRRFEFEWGVEVVAKVRESLVLNPPADGSSVRYGLVSVVESSPVQPGTPFVWTYDSFDVRPGWGDPWIDVESERLLDGTPFTCTSAEACEAVQVSYEDGTEIEVTFEFDGDGGIELVSAEPG